MLFLESKLNTKEGTANDRAHLFIFTKFIKKKPIKKLQMRKMSKAIKENKLTVTIKRLLWEFSLYWRFMCKHKSND